MPIIDERIVKMEFDNDGFEQGIDESLKSLNVFDQELNGFAENTNFGQVGIIADKVSEKFDALRIMAETVVYRITNSVMDAVGQATRAINQLTFQPVTLGMDNYERKVESVQTIMNATGLSIEEVNNQLNKLMWYTDETSYSYTDMASNIGKFTAVGIELDDAVTAMMGIANWAGVSGANINQASHAMYNLSQALSTGSVKKQDWISINNAQMATEEFKQTVIDTAREFKAFGDEYTDITAKYGKDSEQFAKAIAKNGHTVEEAMKLMDFALLEPADVGWEGLNFANFDQTLSSGWFTSDVLIKSLEKYGNYTDELYKLYETGEYDTFSDVKEAYEKNVQPLMDEIFSTYKEYGKQSEEFQKLLKDNNISMQTALDLIDVKEAKNFNENLMSIQETLLETANKYGIASDEFAQAAKDSGYSINDAADIVLNGVDKFKKAERSLGEKSLAAAQEAKTFKEAWNATIEAVSSQWTKVWEKIFGNYEEAKVIWTALSNTLWDVFAAPIDRLNQILDITIALGARNTAIEGIKNAWEAILSYVEPVKQAFNDIFSIFGDNVKLGSIINNIVVAFEKWTTTLKANGQVQTEIRAIASKVFSVFSLILTTVKSLVSNIGRIVSALMPNFGTILEMFAQMASKLGNIKSFGENIENAITGFTDKLIFGLLVARAVIFVVAAAIIGKILEIIDTIKTLVGIFTRNTELMNEELVTKWLQSGLLFKITAFRDTVEKIGAGIAAFVIKLWDTIKSIASNVIKAIPDILNGIATAGAVVGGIIGFIIELIQRFVHGIGTFITNFKEFKQGVKDTIGEALKSILPTETINVLFNEAVPILTKITEIIKGLALELASFLETADTGKAIIAGIAIAIGGFLTVIKSKMQEGPAGIIRGIVEFVTGTIDALKTWLTSASNSFQDFVDTIAGPIKELLGMADDGTKALRSFAWSVLILAGAALIFSSIDGQAFIQTMAGLTTVIGEAVAALWALQKFSNILDEKKMAALTSMILMFSAAMFILSAAVLNVGKTFGDYGWQGILASIIVIGLAMYAFTQVMGSLIYNVRHLVKHGGAELEAGIIAVGQLMKALAFSMILISIAVKIIGSMNILDAIQGVVAIALFMAAMDIFIERMKAIDVKRSFGAGVMKVAGSLIMLAIALNLLVVPTVIFGLLPLPMIAKGLGGIVVLLLAFWGFIEGVNHAANVDAKILAVAGSMMMLAVAINALMIPVMIFALLPLGGIVKGLIGIAFILAEVWVFMGLLNIMQISAVKLIAIGLAMTFLGLGLAAMTLPIQTLASLDIKSFAKGLIGMLILMGEITVFMIAIDKLVLGGALTFIGIAVGIVALAFGLGAMVDVIERIGTSDFATMLQGFLGLAGILAALVIISSILSTFAPQMLIFGASIAVVGAGLWLLGVGIDSVHNAFLGIAEDPHIKKFGEWLGDSIKGTIDGLGMALDIFLGFVLGFLDDLKQKWDTFWKGYGAYLKDWLKTDFVDNWSQGVDEIKDFVADKWDEMWTNVLHDWYEFWDNWDLGWKEIVNGISGRVTEIGDKIKEGFDNWNKFFEGAGAEFYELNSAGWSEIEDSIQGVVDKFTAFVDTWKTGWEEIKGGWDEFWGNWGTGWEEIQNGWNNFWSPEQGKKEGADYAKGQIKGYEDAYEIHSPSKRTEYEGKMKTEGDAKGLADPEAQKHLKDAAEENAEIISTAYRKGSAHDRKEQLMYAKETVDETKKTVEKEAEKVDLKKSLTDKVYGWINDASFLNEDQKKWVKEKFDSFVGGINFDGLSLPDVNSLFENFTGGLEVPEVPELDLSKWEEQINNATNGVNGLDDADLSNLTNGLDTSTLSANNLSDSIAGINDNLANTGDLSNGLSLSDIFGTSDLSTKAEAEGAAIGDGIKTGITDSTRKLTYNDIIHRNAIMRAAQKDGIWSESFDKALKAAGYTDDFYSTADRLKIYNEARATRTANFNDRINIKDSAELYRLITTLNDHGVLSAEFENALRSYYGDDYKEMTAKEKNEVVAALAEQYAKEEEFIANNYDAILRAYENGTGSAAFKEFFVTSGSNDRDLNDFIDRVKASKYYNDKQLAEAEKQSKDLGTMSEVVNAFNQVIDTDGVKVTMAKAKTDVLESALKVIESSTQKDGVKKNSLEYVQALDQLNWSYEDAEEYLKLKAEEDKKKAGGTTTTTQQKATTSSTSETKANTTSTYNPVTTVKADNVTVDTKTTTATAQTSAQNAGDISGYIKEGVQKLTNIDATITLMNTKIDQMAETIVIMNETALNELALLNGWKGEVGAHNAAVEVRLAGIQNKGVPIANRMTFMNEVANSVDSILGDKAARRVRGN